MGGLYNSLIFGGLIIILPFQESIIFAKLITKLY